MEPSPTDRGITAIKQAVHGIPEHYVTFAWIVDKRGNRISAQGSGRGHKS
jgi:hypothetical protein